MSVKKDQDQLSDINRQMLEIKKKIQLSEGQRKALFEECEAERKSNVEEITKLKKKNSDLIKQLHASKNIIGNLKNQNKFIESIIGPLNDKSGDEIHDLLDLHIIDKSKQLNLIRYRIIQSQKHLTEIGKEYQNLSLIPKNKKELTEITTKQLTCNLQNNIHAVQVQLREAYHIRTRYKDIKKALRNDSAKFESSIVKINEDLQAQQADITKLQQVMEEAIRMRSIARSNLLHQERAALISTNTRDRQTFEGKRLVNNRRQELEQLEKRIFQSGKIAIRPEPEGAEDNVPDDETPETTSSQPKSDLSEVFEILKQTTGGTSAEEILERFNSQKDTHARLILLRKNSENEKKLLEKHLNALNVEYERYKYEQVKDAERKSTEMERIKKLIEKREESRKFEEEKANKYLLMKSVLNSLQSLHLCINPHAIPENDALKTLENIKIELAKILNKSDKEDDNDNNEERNEKKTEIDEKWLPSLYSGLIRRTPQSQQGVSPAPPPPPPTGSEDEEEVPSRSYLKRQAQLVVDAKLRRKNIRMQFPKRI